MTVSENFYVLMDKNGNDGGIYTSRQGKQMKARAWVMNRGGSLVQVWRATIHGEPLAYDAAATRRVTDYIVKANKALAEL